MTYSSAPRVMVVEDSLPIREALMAAFEDAGFTAASLPDGDDFETTMAGFRPDVVILDVMLPGARDGFALIDIVRQSSDAGIIMVTAKDRLEDRLRGLTDGADDYVVKRFSSTRWSHERNRCCVDAADPRTPSKWAIYWSTSPRGSSPAPVTSSI